MHPSNCSPFSSPSSPTPRRPRNAAALRRAVDNTLQPLESRQFLSVTATAANGVLTVTGDDHDGGSGRDLLIGSPATTPSSAAPAATS